MLLDYNIVVLVCRLEPDGHNVGSLLDDDLAKLCIQYVSVFGPHAYVGFMARSLIS